MCVCVCVCVWGGGGGGGAMYVCTVTSSFILDLNCQVHIP